MTAPSGDLARASRAAPSATHAGGDGPQGDDDPTERWGAEDMRGVAARLKRTARSLEARDPVVARAFERGGERFERLARALDSATPELETRDALELVRKLSHVLGDSLILGAAAVRSMKRQSQHATNEPERAGERTEVPRSGARPPP